MGYAWGSYGIIGELSLPSCVRHSFACPHPLETTILGRFLTLPQVPSQGFPWRYVLLFCGHGILGSRNPRSFLQDTSPILFTSSLQLYPFVSPIVPAGGLPSASITEVSGLHRAFRPVLTSQSRFNPQTGLLNPSLVFFERAPPSHTRIVLQVLEALRLVKLERLPARTQTNSSDPAASKTSALSPVTRTGRSGQIISSTNLTILNFLLVHFGPLHERSLCSLMGIIQVGCSVLAFAIRYGAAGWVYGGDRR